MSSLNSSLLSDAPMVAFRDQKRRYIARIPLDLSGGLFVSIRPVLLRSEVRNMPDAWYVCSLLRREPRLTQLQGW